jgi:hypothetical protein
MPDWFPSWTNCSSPSGWYQMPVAQSVLLGAAGLAAGATLAFASAFAPGVAVVSAGLCLAGVTFCTWWLNIRLICLGGDRSAIGAIYNVLPPKAGAAWEFGDYDTDFSFNLLISPFIPQDELPSSFVNNQWSPSAIPQLTSAWPTLFPSIPFNEVAMQLPLILPQQTMASLHLGFNGQDVKGPDEPNYPNPPPPGGSSQHFLLHCEIEGRGMYDLRTLFWVLFGMFIAAAIVYLIPIIGPILSAILALFAWLIALFGGSAIQHEGASPPSGGDWGGSLNPYRLDHASPDRNSPVDIVYVFGRWVYDSLHEGWNELHPVHFMIKIGQTTWGNLAGGNWPANLGDTQGRLDTQFQLINSPGAPQIQAEPQNQWSLHPVLDGCQGATPYPTPPPPQITQ